MSGHIQLVVGDRVEFEVKFALNDAGTEKPFGMRLSATRQTRAEMDRDLPRGANVQEYLQARDLTLVAWTGKSPLQDDKGEAVPAGKEALAALFDLVGGMVTLVFTSYLDATSAKGRSGN